MSNIDIPVWERLDPEEYERAFGIKEETGEYVTIYPAISFKAKAKLDKMRSGGKPISQIIEELIMEK